MLIAYIEGNSLSIVWPNVIIIVVILIEVVD